LVGIVGLCREERQKSSHKGYLWGMYVAREHRYRGIGRTLVLQALQFAASVPGFLQVNLFVIATNEPAVRLYESVGFQPYGLERNSICVAGEYYDEILMARTLRS
jgi:RimJ/RimL family protein N-acetyltransferase